MLRTLYLVRHAKASLDTATQSDYDRPLNDRGERDAPNMGLRLREKGANPQMVLASAARRTTQTAKRIATAMRLPDDHISLTKDLYQSSPESIARQINGVDATVTELMIIAHNPGITELSNQLSDAFRVDNMPTCGVVGVRAEAADWREFWEAAKEVFLFEYPKKGG